MPLRKGRADVFRYFHLVLRRISLLLTLSQRRTCMLPFALALLLGFLIGNQLSFLPSKHRSMPHSPFVLIPLNFSYLHKKLPSSDLRSPRGQEDDPPLIVTSGVKDDDLQARPLQQQKQGQKLKEKATGKKEKTIAVVGKKPSSEGDNEVFKRFPGRKSWAASFDVSMPTGATNCYQNFENNDNSNTNNENNNKNKNEVFRAPIAVGPEGGSPDDDFDNEAPFRYLINEAQFCQLRPGLRILNLVGTAPGEFAARSLIRSLWGSPRWFNATGFAVAFVLGTTKDAAVTKRVQVESATFHDLLQVDLVDSYENLTFKMQTELHWTAAFCPKAAWLLKSDRDVFINIFNLKSILDKYEMKRQQDIAEGISLKGPQFICRRKPKNALTPCRTWRDCPQKWRVTYREYPHPHYPNHCCGPAYLVPRELVRKLYRGANKTHPFRLEDVYYTGILPTALGLNVSIANLGNRFPWRPHQWYESFTTTSVMILELEKGLGNGTSARVWQQIVKNYTLNQRH